MKRIKMHLELNKPSVCWHWPTFSIIDLQLSFTHKGDHSPRIDALLIIGGIKLIDFSYYNTCHEEE